MEGVGHVHACLGIGRSLRQRGHKVVFYVEKVWQGKLDNYDFCFEYYADEAKEANRSTEAPGQHLAKVMLDHGMIGKGSSYEKYANINKFALHTFNAEKLKRHEVDLKARIEKHQPDVFIIDHFNLSPFINYSGKPWVRIVSTTPFFFELDFEAIPPAGSGTVSIVYHEGLTNSIYSLGYPVDGDRKNWPQFRELNRGFLCDARWNEIVTSFGFPPYKDDIRMPYTYSLSIYGYPEEFSYKHVVQYPSNWVNVDTLMRPDETEHFEVPQVLEDAKKDYPGRLIYVSLGSMCSGDLVFMRRLVAILGTTKHRYIVSKGPRHDEYELPANMWGDRFLPQTAVLKKVDLIIGHGGCNTFTETIAHGRPLIIFPMFGDQFDHLRAQELGFVVQFDPYDFDTQDLLAAIDRLLYDEPMRQKLTNISKRILGKDRYKEATDRIEALVQ